MGRNYINGGDNLVELSSSMERYHHVGNFIQKNIQHTTASILYFESLIHLIRVQRQFFIKVEIVFHKSPKRNNNKNNFKEIFSIGDFMKKKSLIMGYYKTGPKLIFGGRPPTQFLVFLSFFFLPHFTNVSENSKNQIEITRADGSFGSPRKESKHRYHGSYVKSNNARGLEK